MDSKHLEGSMDKDNVELDKRELRRKRRIRNQVISYVVIVAILGGLATGAFFAGKFVADKRKAEKEAQMAATLEEMKETEAQEEVVISEPEPVEVEPTPEERLDEVVNAAIEVMPIEDKVAGLFLVTPESITGVNTAVKAGDGTKEALSKYAVGGLIYFSKNIESSEQITEMISNTKEWSKYPLFIGVDEEGGEVSRIANSKIEVTKVDNAATLAKTGDTTQAYSAGTTIATYLTTLGFNLDFAPVADVMTSEDSIIGERSYGSDAALVSGFASSMVSGLQDMGVSACMKHFPGLGGTKEDTHDGMASTDRTLEDYRSTDFLVYKAGIEVGTDFIMISHLSAPQLTGDNTPCSLSKAVVTDLLRSELQYNGVVISDAMNMEAITAYYTADQAAILALKAGCDMILMPEDFEVAYEGVLQAVEDGTIAEERIDDALRRIYRIKLSGALDE